jgi:hypothetical protein
MQLFAPIPSDRDMTATAVKLRFWRSMRTAKRRSFVRLLKAPPAWLDGGRRTGLGFSMEGYWSSQIWSNSGRNPVEVI